MSRRRLGAVVGMERVVPGVVRMPADIREPGIVRHPSEIHELFIGEPDGTRSARVDAFNDAVNGAGMTGIVADDIRATLWGKFVMQSAFSALTALTRLNIGPIRETSETLALLEAAIDEAAEVSRAASPAFHEGMAANAKAFLLERAPPHVHASMLDDLNRGKRIELDYLSGEVVRLGRAAGVPTPVHSFVTAALTPYLNGAPG